MTKTVSARLDANEEWMVMELINSLKKEFASDVVREGIQLLYRESKMMEAQQPTMAQGVSLKGVSLKDDEKSMVRDLLPLYEGKWSRVLGAGIRELHASKFPLRLAGMMRKFLFA